MNEFSPIYIRLSLEVTCTYHLQALDDLFMIHINGLPGCPRLHQHNSKHVLCRINIILRHEVHLWQLHKFFIDLKETTVTVVLIISSMLSLRSCSSFFLYSLSLLSLSLSLSLCIIILCSRDTAFPLLTNVHSFTFINGGYHLHEHNIITHISIHLITSWGSGVGWALGLGG